ncbi:MAG TPA: helix-turn-helix domain-containing protein [Pyrinomonadaceae bacterium]|nr:helix-turn-helix domain-containing protein [Pyrinomonadaceae bacterium]
MNLADAQLDEVDDPSLTADERAVLRCRVAADLIQAGQYESAREALGEIWRGVGERPNVEGLEERAVAEVLLQGGVLSGWIGAGRQVAGAQEAAKDLISESAALFERLGETERAAGARSDLAVCYWREGAYDEARVLLNSAFDELTETVERAKVLLRLVTVELAAARYNSALTLLTNYAQIFDERVSHALRGSFHNLLAVVLKQLGTAERRHDYLDRAIIEYTEAIHHFTEARHDRYVAHTENNLGNLLRKMGLYEQAHEHLDRAGVIFVSHDDAGRLAQVDETRARVLIDEKQYREAGRVIAGAVRTLEKGGGSALLAEALTTQGVALARLGDNELSINTLRRAVSVAEESGALSNAGLAALTLIEEHGARDALSEKELYKLYRQANEMLKDVQDVETVARLRECAGIVMRKLAGVRLGDENFTLFGAVREFEAKLIGKALEEADGSVTKAARLLGIRHQSLLAMLNARHRKLLEKRKPQEKRKRSIIKRDM